MILSIRHRRDRSLRPRAPYPSITRIIRDAHQQGTAMTSKNRHGAGRAGGRWLLTGAFLLAAGLSCGPAAAQEVTPPADIAKAQQIVYCAAVGAPPLSYYKEDGKLVGLEIDFGEDLARRLGVKAVWKDVQFDGIIPALLAKHCDAIISGLYNRPKRREVVDFIDYMSSSQTVLTRKGNPRGIKTLDDLSGLKMSVSNGTTIQSIAEQENEKLKAAGKAPIDIVVFPKEVDALQSLRIDQTQAYGTSIEISAYYIFQAPELFELAGEPFNHINAGIGLRKDDPDLTKALTKAFDGMKADGAYRSLMAKYGFEQLMLQ